MEQKSGMVVKMVCALQNDHPNGMASSAERRETGWEESFIVGKQYEPIIDVMNGPFSLGLRGDKGAVVRKDTYTVLPADFV
ncbi:MAG: hypothetical protein IJJ26_06415, partial [Victivallales bacterium]|nr:hypothetical protein [Victivallales bacterium]